MRDGFRTVTSGWTLIDGFNAITECIEATAEWAKANGPLQPDEQATVELMIRAQIARGMPEMVRMLGMEREFGLPMEEDTPDAP